MSSSMIWQSASVSCPPRLWDISRNSRAVIASDRSGKRRTTSENDSRGNRFALFKRSYASISNVIVLVAIISQYTITHESQYFGGPRLSVELEKRFYKGGQELKSSEDRLPKQPTGQTQ